MGYRADVHLDDARRVRTLAADVRRGLRRRRKSLPPKYFYDAEGSALFDRITRLPEYYVTRAEEALLDAHAPAVMDTVRPREIVELGAGSPAKARKLLHAMNGGGPLRRYVPVDVDAGTLADAGDALLREHPALDIHAVVGDFERHLNRVPAPVGRRLVVFLGSTIGNLDRRARRRLLARVRALLRRGDRLLLGVDLVKDRATLEAAYDDGAGVTAAFNRNILRVVNRALGADFAPDAFRHRARWNARASRVEMHLVPESPQEVHVRALGMTVAVAPEETIWTESSYKFTAASAGGMLREAGLRVESWLTDDLFALVLASAASA